MSAERSARSVSETEGVDRVRALQRVLYRSAKQDPARRFHSLYHHVARSDILWRAWRDVAANRGAPGVDGQKIEDIEDSGVGEFLSSLAEELKAKSYRPQPLRRVDIPKPGRSGATRPLGIPTVSDRVVMAAAKIVLEPVFEADFLPSSFGFRPKRSAHMANEAIRAEANRGADWVLDADVSDCFGSIDHDALMTLVSKRVVDRQMLKLIRSWLRAGVLENGVMSDAASGTPQGSPLSPLLANIALNVLDCEWEKARRGLGVLVRYADDFVVLCATRARAEQSRDRATAVLRTLGLQLHPEKTRIVRLTKGEEGFDFLGFHHRKVEAWRWPGRFYMQRWPSKRAMGSIRDKVRAQTEMRFVGYSLETAVERLNPILRGWGNYFCYGNSSRKFTTVDSYVHMRLARLASMKYGLSHRNWAKGNRFDLQWLSGLGVHRLTGTVRRRGIAHA